MALTEDDLNQMLAMYEAKAKRQADETAFKLDIARKKWMLEQRLKWDLPKQSLPEPDFSLEELEMAEKMVKDAISGGNRCLD